MMARSSAAERLAVVDPFQFAGLEELREELVSIIDAHVATLHPVPRVVFAGRDGDILLLELPANAHLQINALQRAAALVIQKSTREGFGLTVAEAMWKGKPVIAGATGGISVQVLYGVTGYTVSSVEGCAYRIRYLLNNPQLMRRMGEAGREHVRQNFLITRHLRDYLSLLAHLTR